MNQDALEFESLRQNPRTPYRNRLIILAVLAAVLLAVVISLSLFAPKPASHRAGSGTGASPVIVETANAIPGSMNFTVEADASVVPTPEVWISTDQVGWVRKIDVKVGQKVESGQVVAVMQPMEDSSQSLADSYRTATQGLRLSQTEQLGAENALVSSQSAVVTAESRVVEAKADLTALQNESRASEAQVRAAAQSLRESEEEFAQTAKLFSAGAVSRDNLDRARGARRQAAANLDQLKQSNQAKQAELAAARDRVTAEQASLAQAEERVTRAQGQVQSARKSVREQKNAVSLLQARLQNAKRKESMVRMESPVDGVVSEIPGKPGALVTPSVIIARIKRPDVSVVSLELPESSASKLRTNRTAVITVPGSPQEIKGKVVAVEPSSVSPDKFKKVTIEVEDTPKPLKPGTAVEASITYGSATGVIVPRSAVVKTDQGQAVWVARDGAAHMQPVQVAESSDTKAVITKGLGRGSRVIINAGRPLKEGAPVTMKS